MPYKQIKGDKHKMYIFKKHAIAAVLFSVVAVFLSGCATVRNPVPGAKTIKAEIPGMPEIRSFVGLSGTELEENLIRSIKQEREDDFPVDKDGVKEYSKLILSGGSSDGAYGAGLLNGWSDAGDRPLFKIVTGVSTGAIMAPLVFLGEDYNETMKTYYTTKGTKDVFRVKGPFGVLFGDSLANSNPLAAQIESLFKDETLRKIAREHERGRRLFVGTVNLDAQKFVVWDMGAIALRKEKELFRKVILASASIPAMFPPVYFDVSINGKEYDEMHVDGGTLEQMFSMYDIIPTMEDAVLRKAPGIREIRSRIYIIRNGYMSPRYTQVEGKLLPITKRALNTILDAQSVGDAYRIYSFSKRQGSDYNLAFIPPDHSSEAKEIFDPSEMKRLYQRGYKEAIDGYDWHKAPPGYYSDEFPKH